MAQRLGADRAGAAKVGGCGVFGVGESAELAGGRQKLVGAAGQVIGEQADPFVDAAVDILQVVGQAPADPGQKGTAAEIGGVGQGDPSLRTKSPDRARHMSGAGDKHPGLAGLRIGQSLGIFGVLRSVARRAINQQMFGRNPQAEEKGFSHRGLLRVPMDYPPRAAGEEQLRLGMAQRQSCGGEVALGGTVENRLTPGLGQKGAFTAAKKQDPVDLRGQLGRRKAPLQWFQQEIAKGKNGDRKKQDQGRPDESGPSKQQSRKSEENDPAFKEKTKPNQFTNDEEKCVHRGCLDGFVPGVMCREAYRRAPILE